MAKDQYLSRGIWVKAMAASELEPDDADRFDYDGQCIAIYNVDNEYLATGGICSHEHAFLSEGYVADGTVECPLHQGIFNIRTGRPLSPPVTIALKTFKTKVEEGHIYVFVEN